MISYSQEHHHINICFLSHWVLLDTVHLALCPSLNLLVPNPKQRGGLHQLIGQNKNFDKTYEDQPSSQILLRILLKDGIRSFLIYKFFFRILWPEEGVGQPMCELFNTSSGSHWFLLHTLSVYLALNNHHNTYRLQRHLYLFTEVLRTPLHLHMYSPWLLTHNNYITFKLNVSLSDRQNQC